MDIFKAYDIIKGKIEDDYLVENYKCIEHGLQFYIYHPHNKDLVRIYKNKKTGLTVDVSAVRDETLKHIVKNIDLNEDNTVSYIKNDALSNKFLAFKSAVREFGFSIIDYKKINNGLQFRVKFPNDEHELVRIFNSSKYGIRIDFSMFKYSHNLSKLYEIEELHYKYLKKQTQEIKKSKKKVKDEPTKQPENKPKKKTKKQLRKEIKEAKAQKPLLDDIANKIIDYTKKNGIVSILRYDSKISESIYLKFDYGMSGSLRISAHDSKKDLSYTFNIIKGLTKPWKESVSADNGIDFERYYYPYEMAGSAARDILRYKDFRIQKYTYEKYMHYLEEHKKSVGVKKGFWSKAKEV